MFSLSSNLLCNTGLDEVVTLPKMHPSTARLFDAARLPDGDNGTAALARLLNVSDQRVTNWKKRGISLEAALDAQRKIGVNAVWLLDGAGSQTPPASPADQDAASINPVAVGVVSFLAADLAYHLDQLPNNYKLRSEAHHMAVSAIKAAARSGSVVVDAGESPPPHDAPTPAPHQSLTEGKPPA